jgi:uncharacterized protein YidB (DUF937 family)
MHLADPEWTYSSAARSEVCRCRITVESRLRNSAFAALAAPVKPHICRQALRPQEAAFCHRRLPRCRRRSVSIVVPVVLGMHGPVRPVKLRYPAFHVWGKTMLINPDEVVTGALVNAIAVVGRQISKAASGLRKPDEDLATARWFETFRLTGSLPELSDFPPASGERLVEVLSSDEIQAALQELLAVRLTDAPETDASRAREAVHAALSAAHLDSTSLAEALAGYYDDQICSLVARLEAEEPPLLAQIRSEAFSSRMISILHAIERNTAARAGKYAVPVSGSHDVLADDRNTQADDYVIGEYARPQRAAGSAGGAPPGRPLAEVTDPFALEVHHPVVVSPGGEGLPVLPPYVRRPHDDELAKVVRQAADGRSGMAVLVGGSSTGKTRACWEAVHALPTGWWLWHPFDPTRPEAALARLPWVGPQTVVWLNDTQLYLDTGDTGERIAAALRTLLMDSSRAPVLVLGTLWPAHWDTLTRDQASHPQARTVLAGADIAVPAAFTGPALQDLMRAATADARLALAAKDARDGQVTQYLAGVPELLARYRNAPPAARALIHAAMDARRLGHRLALPHTLLAAAAPAYLSDAEWDAVGDDWLEEALAYAAAPRKGVPGPITRVRPRPDRSRHTRPGRGSGEEQLARGQAHDVSGPAYRLADYLDQHGQIHRATEIPPPGFWTAAADHAQPADQAALADAANDRGLYRDAAQLRKRATGRGNPHAAASLITSMRRLHPADHRPGDWAAGHADLSDSATVAFLLGHFLQGAGAEEQLHTLLGRDPAGHASLSDPYAVAAMLAYLLGAGAEEQVRTLLGRDPAGHASLSDPYAVADLLDCLREAGAEEQVRTLASRAARHADLSDPAAVAFLLGRLREAGAKEQVRMLLDRDPAGHAGLNDPAAVAVLLDRLREAGAHEQARTLAERAAGHADLSDPRAVAFLLGRLREAGADEQATALVDRVAGHADLSDPAAAADLLDRLREAGADEQVRTLLGRDPAEHADLSDPAAVADLLDGLREAGAHEQVRTLADRAAGHADLSDPAAVADLLDRLREAGADEQASALLGRDPAGHADLSDPAAVADLLDRLREAGADEQVRTLLGRDPAGHADLSDPAAVAVLLDRLREASAEEQARTLADRAAGYADLSDPRAVAFLLGRLREASAEEQVRVLLGRDPAGHADLSDPAAVAVLLDRLREAGADEQASALLGRDPAGHAALSDPAAVAVLLGSLQEMGADDQARTLVDRLSAAGRFGFFQEYFGPRFRFGREQDGQPAEFWDWDDLG